MVPQDSGLRQAEGRTDGFLLPAFPATFPQFPQSFPQSVGKLWKAPSKILRHCGNAEKTAEKHRKSAVESSFPQVVENSVENVENSGFCALHTGFPQAFSKEFSGVENGCRRFLRQKAKTCQIREAPQAFPQVVPRFPLVLPPVFLPGSPQKREIIAPGTQKIVQIRFFHSLNTPYYYDYDLYLSIFSLFLFAGKRDQLLIFLPAIRCRTTFRLFHFKSCSSAFIYTDHLMSHNITNSTITYITIKFEASSWGPGGFSERSPRAEFGTASQGLLRGPTILSHSKR